MKSSLTNFAFVKNIKMLGSQLSNKIDIICREMKLNNFAFDFELASFFVKSKIIIFFFSIFFNYITYSTPILIPLMSKHMLLLNSEF